MALANRKTEKIRRPDFKAMDDKRWAEFDSDLRIRMAESRQTRYDKPQPAGNVDKSNMEEDYARLTHMVSETIDKIVPSKTNQ